MAKIKAAVIFGGVSGEHALSLASAAEVIRNIPADKYEVICIGITRKGRWLYFPGDVSEIASGKWEFNPDCTSAFISPDPIYKGIVTIENGETSIKRVDVVFPVLQGKYGADGSLQGLLDLAGIPYVGCGLLASASCMDKSHTHMILDDYNIKTAKWRLITQREINYLDKRCSEIASELGFPLMIRPANSGSSAGSGKACDIMQLEAAVKTAFSHDNKVVVEEYISGRELEIAVFGYDNPFASNAGEIRSRESYSGSREECVSEKGLMEIPADLTSDEMNRIKETAVSAYKALGCKGMARVDFFLREDGELCLNKVSTMPGFKADCIYPQLMKELGMELPYLIDKLLEQAIDNAERAY
ncbi:MAG: D-alanine--D-alanine ligase [Ruminococcus sp.]|nr:D-alanine--D-alanine ligase [Ruminococcus sp.]